jgi:hypothetical protein
VSADDGAGGNLAERYRARLPKAVIGKGCVRIRRLDDVEEPVLGEMIREAATSAGLGEV